MSRFIIRFLRQTSPLRLKSLKLPRYCICSFSNWCSCSLIVCLILNVPQYRIVMINTETRVPSRWRSVYNNRLLHRVVVWDRRIEIPGSLSYCTYIYCYQITTHPSTPATPYTLILTTYLSLLPLSWRTSQTWPTFHRELSHFGGIYA